MSTRRSAHKRRGRRSQTRVVTYAVEWPEDSSLEHPVRAILRRHPSVTQFGTSEIGVWFNGTPGDDLRAARAEIEALLKTRSLRESSR